jgi:hypothetical protein
MQVMLPDEGKGPSEDEPWQVGASPILPFWTSRVMSALAETVLPVPVIASMPSAREGVMSVRLEMRAVAVENFILIYWGLNFEF